MPRAAGRVPTVFISYRRDDSGDVTGRIRDQVVAAYGQEHVYMDIDSIPLGVDFRTHLAESVARCDVVLAIIGKDWLTAADDAGNRRLDNPRDFVRLELEAALERDIPVVPVLVLGAEPLPPDALPPSIQDLAFRQATPVRRDPDFHPDMYRLLDGLGRTTTAAKSVPTAAKGATPKAPDAVTPVITAEATDDHRSRRFVIIGAAVAVAVAVVAVGVVALSGGGDSKATKDSARSGSLATPPSSTVTSSGAAGSTTTSLVPLITGQTGQTVHARGFTMTLPPKWSTDGSDNDNVSYLPEGGSVWLHVSGPFSASGQSAIFKARQAAESSTAKSHTDPTTQTIDGVETAQFSEEKSFGREVTMFAVVGDKQYTFDLNLLSSMSGKPDKPIADFQSIISSISWDK